MENLRFILKILGGYLILSIACFLMMRSILGYTAFKDDVQFLAFKQAYVHDGVWKTAFYIHVFSVVVALFAGFTQFSSQILRKAAGCTG